ncbi:hypothetical protein BD414DRAFT_265491 [Trametes punicea]|nr:hypothetical protein BD414DRAFT_265491 [Trametes punicea]
MGRRGVADDKPMSHTSEGRRRYAGSIAKARSPPFGYSAGAETSCYSVPYQAIQPISTLAEATLALAVGLSAAFDSIGQRPQAAPQNNDSAEACDSIQAVDQGASRPWHEDRGACCDIPQRRPDTAPCGNPNCRREIYSSPGASL